jgi:hypothetical protein
MTDGKDIEDTPMTEEEKLLMDEWEKYMHDFVPEDVISFVVDPRSEFVLTLFPNSYRQCTKI